LPPEELRRRQLAALTNWWMTGAQAQPAVIVEQRCPRTSFGKAAQKVDRGRIGPVEVFPDVDQMFKDAWENGLATSRFFALWSALLLDTVCGNYAAANARVDELVALANEKDAQAWSTWGTLARGHLLALTGDPSGAVHRLTSSIAACRSMGPIVFLPVYLSALAKAHAELAQLDEACGYMGEAMTLIETRRIRWWEADVNRIAGEITLMSPEHDVAKAAVYFERALRSRVNNKPNPGNSAPP
jgi:hypothetical protein